MPAKILTVKGTPDGRTSADHVEVTEWQREVVESVIQSVTNINRIELQPLGSRNRTTITDKPNAQIEGD